MAKDEGSKGGTSQRRCLAGDEGLPGRRGLAAIRRQGRVRTDQLESVDRNAKCIGGDLSDDGVRSLTDIGRPLMQPERALARDANTDGGGVGEAGIAAAIPAGRDADAAPGDRVTSPLFVVIMLGRVSQRPLPVRGEGIEAIADADRLQPLATGRRIAVSKRIQPAEGETVLPALFRKLVIQHLQADGRLRHAKAAKSTGDRPMGVKGAGGGAIIRGSIGAGGVNGNPARHGRSPARIGAGIEVAVKGHARHAPFAIGTDRRFEPCRMALGAGPHGLRAGKDHAAGTPGLENSEPQKRLHGKVELAAKTAARG